MKLSRATSHLAGALAVCAIGLAASGLWIGCARHHRKQVTGAFLDDQVTAARVKQALQPLLQSGLTNVQIIASNGVVILNGSVKDEDQKEKAVEIANGVERVIKVKNELRVQH